MKKIDKIIHNIFMIGGLGILCTIGIFIIGSLVVASINLIKEDVYLFLTYVVYFALIGLLLYPFIRSFKGGWKS